MGSGFCATWLRIACLPRHWKTLHLQGDPEGLIPARKADKTPRIQGAHSKRKANGWSRQWYARFLPALHRHHQHPPTSSPPSSPSLSASSSSSPLLSSSVLLHVSPDRRSPKSPINLVAPPPFSTKEDRDHHGNRTVKRGENTQAWCDVGPWVGRYRAHCALL